MGVHHSIKYCGGTVSESVLGDYLRFTGVPRDSFVVATECGNYKEGFDSSIARVTRSVDESLACLSLDYVDILHCHDIQFTNLDQVTLISAQSLATLVAHIVRSSAAKLTHESYNQLPTK
ncbi:L-galactose dehydrogenase [Hordeum vulgare]|nr:L-galactose dehydrogenase [Hordeum vulgare]